MGAIGIVVRVDGHRAEAEHRGGRHDPDRDLTTSRHQQRAEVADHRSSAGGSMPISVDPLKLPTADDDTACPGTTGITFCFPALAHPSPGARRRRVMIG
jgi:hypothetical protein